MMAHTCACMLQVLSICTALVSYTMISGTAMFYCSTKARTKLQNSLILVRTCLEMSTYHRRIIADARDFPAPLVTCRGTGISSRGKGRSFVPMSIKWVAPEVAEECSPRGSAHNKATDVFAFGLVRVHAAHPLPLAL
jgi:hypothetical protein